MTKTYTVPVHVRMVVPANVDLESPLVVTPGEQVRFAGVHTCRDGSRHLVAPILTTEHPLFHDTDVFRYATMIVEAALSYSHSRVAA